MSESPFTFDVSQYPKLPQMRGLMIVGTDTEVGKTLIAGGISETLNRKGKRVGVFKPVASGCVKYRGELVAEDAQFLAACADSLQSLSEVTPLRFKAALAPNVAAAREGKPVDIERIFEGYRRIEGSCDRVIVEGVGGLLCPISDDFWVIHLAKMLGLPVIIVARSGLGTINHTLLTLHAARHAGLNVAGVVMNRYPADLRVDERSALPAADDSDIAMLTNPSQIEQRGKTRIIAKVPDEKDNSVHRVTLGENTRFVLDQVDWDSLM